MLAPTNTVDDSQLGGTFYDPVATSQTRFGSQIITNISLLIDPGYTQTVEFDNVNVNGTVYTFDQPQNKDECKDNGWQNLTDNQGNHFKNQGDCIQFSNNGH